MKQPDPFTTVARVGFFVAALALPAAPTAAPAGDEPWPPLRLQEQWLREAGATLDEAGLRAFLRQQELPAADPRDVPRLIGQLGSAMFADREDASARLIGLGKSAVEGLRRAAESKDTEVANRARVCLREIERRPHLLGAAARVLGHQKGVEAVRPLLGSKDGGVRGAAAWALGELGDQGAVPWLIDLLGDPAEEVRESGCSALYKLAGPESLPALLRAAKAERPEARRLAVRLLRKFSDHAGAVVPTLLEALRDEHATVRAAAASSLHVFGADDRVVPALRAALKDKAPPPWPDVGSVSYVAANSLAFLKGGTAEPALPDLIEEARRGESEFQWNAIRALGFIGRREEGLRPKLLPVLVELLKAKDPEIARSAAGSLGMLGPGAKEAARAMGELLMRRDVADAEQARLIRLSVLEAFQEMGPAAAGAIPEIITILDDQALSVGEREAAARALGNIGDKARTAAPALKRATKDPESRVETAARQALMKIQH